MSAELLALKYEFRSPLVLGFKVDCKQSFINLVGEEFYEDL